VPAEGVRLAEGQPGTCAAESRQEERSGSRVHGLRIGVRARGRAENVDSVGDVEGGVEAQLALDHGTGVPPWGERLPAGDQRVQARAGCDGAAKVQRAT
jgi:hypothetical protein